MKKLIHVGVVVFAVGCLDYTDRGVSPEFEAILAGQPGADAGSAEPGEGPFNRDRTEVLRGARV